MKILFFILILVLIIVLFKNKKENFNIEINNKFNVDEFVEIDKEYDFIENNYDFKFKNNLQNIKYHKPTNYDVSYNYMDYKI